MSDLRDQAVNQAGRRPLDRTVNVTRSKADGFGRLDPLEKGIALALCAYLAAPLFDVPFIGLSYSSPLVGLLVLVLYMRGGGFHFVGMKGLVFLLFIMFAGIGAGLFYRELSGPGLPNYGKAVKFWMLFGYWMSCCLLACHYFAFTSLPSRAAHWLAVAVVVMAIFIILEFFAFGGLHKNGWSRLTAMSQNMYGWQFSTFLPFVYVPLVQKLKRHRLGWYIGVGFCLVAVVILSSRSAWATTVFGIGLFGLLYAVVSGHLRSVLTVYILAAIVAGGTLYLVPEEIKGRITEDANSMEDLENDKSWQGRVVLVRKGLALFEENPVFGTGLGQFTVSDAAVEMPEVFQGRDISDFRGTSPHNSYISLLAEGGLAWAVPFAAMEFWLITAGIFAAMRLARQGEFWGIALVVGLIGMCIHFWSISNLTGTAPWFVFGAVAGMIYRTKRWQDRRFLGR